MELLGGAAERDRVVLREHREAVLRLERVVVEQVVWRERLGSERGEGRAVAGADDDEREERGELRAALVLLRVADEQVVRQVAAEHRVPLADARLEVLENRVVRVRERQELRAARPGRAERRGSRLVDVAARIELVVPERDLVAAVQVVVALDHPRLGRRVLRNVIEGPRVVVELRGQERAEGAEVGRVHASRVADSRRAAGIRREGRQRALIFLLLVRAEGEQLVLDDRTAEPGASDVRRERARVVREARGIRADVGLAALAAVDRTREAVGAAARDGVHAGAGEAALAHVIRRDLHLHLFDRFERNRRDARAVADAAGGYTEAERVVEVRPVHRHVVRPVVLAGERAVAAVLRRQAGDVRDAAGNGGERREILARDRRGGTSARRAEHRVARAGHGYRLGDGRHGQRELDCLGDSKAERDVALGFTAESGQRRRDRVRTTDAHARDEEMSIRLRDAFVVRARGLVHGSDGGARDDSALRVLHDAGRGSRRDALRVREADGIQQRSEGQECDRSQNRATHVFSIVRVR